MPKRPEIDLKKYNADLSQTIVQNVFELLADDVPRYGQEFADLVARNVLSGIVCTLLSRSLGHLPSNTLSDGAGEAVGPSAFTTSRVHISTAVANGFVKAFKRRNPRSDADFRCDVYRIPNPVNRLPL